MIQPSKVINFMGVRHITSAISIVFILISLGALAINGLRFGLDFTGGTQLEVLFDRPADLDKIRDLLDERQLTSPVAAYFGSDREVMIRTQDQMKDKALAALRTQFATVGGAQLEAVERPEREYESFADVLVVANSSADTLRNSQLLGSEYGLVEYLERDGKVLLVLQKSIDAVYLARLIQEMETATGAQIQLRSSEFVGPQIGAELRDQGGLGILAAFFLVFIYVAVQFQWKFSAGAMLGLVHNVIITVGCFALFQWDFDLNVLAAILALIGYSLNDTIVVFDRVRENFRVLRKMDSLEVINISITQTLGRTIMTSVSVYLVLFSLYFIAGDVLQGFAIALIIGVFVGTYASVYIASNVAVALGVSKEDLMPRPKEDTEVDATP